jgi:acetylornithine/N-succinyldiaminopimelate aminotransferase
MLGLRLLVPNTDFVNTALDHKLLTIAAGENVVRLLPPLIAQEGEVREALQRIDAACEAMEGEMRSVARRGAA